MKTKNASIAILVLIFAFGSAFVSISAADPDDQHVRDNMIARDIVDVNCGQGEIPCKVTIAGASANPYQVYTDATLATEVLGSATEELPTSFE